MTMFLTPELSKALGPVRAAEFEAMFAERLAEVRAAHKAELAELIQGFDERLDAFERRES
jgi:hypothetical protein